MNRLEPMAQFLLSKGLTTWFDDEWAMKAKNKDLNTEDLLGRTGGTTSFEEISKMLGEIMSDKKASIS